MKIGVAPTRGLTRFAILTPELNATPTRLKEYFFLAKWHLAARRAK